MVLGCLDKKCFTWNILKEMGKKSLGLPGLKAGENLVCGVEAS